MSTRSAGPPLHPRPSGPGHCTPSWRCPFVPVVRFIIRCPGKMTIHHFYDRKPLRMAKGPARKRSGPEKNQGSATLESPPRKRKRPPAKPGKTLPVGSSCMVRPSLPVNHCGHGKVMQKKAFQLYSLQTVRGLSGIRDSPCQDLHEACDRFLNKGPLFHHQSLETILAALRPKVMVRPQARPVNRFG